MEEIKHECGIVMLRLRRPLNYYKEKYGTMHYGLNKLYLMMEKEHNRGQEGAGVGCVKLYAKPGNEYIFRERAEGSDAITKVWQRIHDTMDAHRQEGVTGEHMLPFIGEAYMGHLRYSTTGRSGIANVHPFMRRNNWKARNMLLCGNFNMTNVDEVFASITAKGQHPRYYADGFILLEQLGHALDRENERVYDIYHKKGLKGLELADAIATDIDMTHVLTRCAPTWDGGYVICGLAGNGDLWAMRDPAGIRPAFYYVDDEVIVVASERPVIQTAFDLEMNQIHELEPGQALIADRNSSYKIEQILPATRKLSCSFERIYFSRGNDADIYRERKALGAALFDSVYKAVDGDVSNTVISFVPNTAEVAYMGLIEEFERRLAEHKLGLGRKLASGEIELTPQIIKELGIHVRKEKVVWKDIKLRTFIAQDDTRNDLAAHVYDITYSSVRPGVDNLVVLDDSIVRGTTLRQSIIRILDRLQPRKIVIVSSSPQVRYPDCYGIDMSSLGEFIAFRAAMEMLHERGLWNVIEDVYRRCKLTEKEPKERQVNHVRDIYAPFTDDEISEKIAQMLTPRSTRAKVRIVYQTVNDMHRAIPGHKGDWYFTGDYPTPGGNRLVNRAFIDYYEQQKGR